MLGFDMSERTVSRMTPSRPADPEARQRWRNVRRNHRKVLAAMDFFAVPTATFRVLDVLFAIHRARRTMLHVRVTEHPTAGPFERVFVTATSGFVCRNRPRADNAGTLPHLMPWPPSRSAAATAL